MNYCMARGEPTFTLTPELRHTSTVVVLGTGAQPVPRVAGAILD